MPERYVPVLFGSLVECQQCWAVVPRWRAGRHNSRHDAQDRRLAGLAERVGVLARDVGELRAAVDAAQAPVREAVPL